MQPVLFPDGLARRTAGDRRSDRGRGRRAVHAVDGRYDLGVIDRALISPEEERVHADW
jgi:hypothetical protein